MHIDFKKEAAKFSKHQSCSKIHLILIRRMRGEMAARNALYNAFLVIFPSLLLILSTFVLGSGYGIWLWLWTAEVSTAKNKLRSRQ